MMTPPQLLHSINYKNNSGSTTNGGKLCPHLHPGGIDPFEAVHVDVLALLVVELQRNTGCLDCLRGVGGQHLDPSWHLCLIGELGVSSTAQQETDAKPPVGHDKLMDPKVEGKDGCRRLVELL